MNFEENDYTFHLKLAKNIIKKLKSSQKLIISYAGELIKSIEEKRFQMEECESVQKLSQFSKKETQLMKKLIYLLAVKNRIDLMIERNLKRCHYIEAQCEKLGIMGNKVDANKLKKATLENLDAITFEKLLLNSAKDEKSTVLINDKIFSVVGNQIDLEDEKNFEIIKNLNYDDLAKILKIYPSMAGSVSVEKLIDNNFRANLLKAITIYVIDEIKEIGIIQVNKNLGELLSFSSQITDSTEAYIYAVINLFNVKIKEYLLKNYPDQNEEIINKFKCNEKSKLIPYGTVDLNLFVLQEKIEEGKNSNEDDETTELSDFISKLFN